MVARISTVAFQGIETVPVDVQVQIAGGAPSFAVVGLPDNAVTLPRPLGRGFGPGSARKTADTVIGLTPRPS